MINYTTQSVRASVNQAGWHQRPIYQTNKSKCNHKKQKRATFSEETLNVLASAERFSFNKCQSIFNILQPWWRSNLGPSYCKLKQQRTKLHAFPLKPRGETGNKLKIKPPPSEKLLNTRLTDYKRLPTAPTQEIRL